MIVILPPSETKAAGGAPGSSLDLGALAFPPLTAIRERVLDATIAKALAAPPAPTPARQRWIDDDRALRTSPTMPAIERYEGVLYDALEAASLDASARAWVDEHVLVGSALWGFVAACDRIPSYRCSSSDLRGALRGAWADAGAVLGGRTVVDLRSKAYVDVAPVPGAIAVDVVGEDGAALNHWNKHAKGALVRRMAVDVVAAVDAAGLASWARDAGIRLRLVDDARLELTATASGLR
ncbi:YaaA family protein [Agrococcus sp. SGAir0287]|uniref:YaaA family protein n=1 Tax=Agrococcus sp. SGAir0287 TaxID=2070347 RepID=UPI0010CD1D0B|nr:peroxide stress protein YaaA [Agrococcus sp. SGAir0287]QCR19678.1 peroxide stress protein YaaA [Agrococcus sp. SGAir0287]